MSEGVPYENLDFGQNQRPSSYSSVEAACAKNDQEGAQLVDLKIYDEIPIPELDGTTLIVQRHAEYIKSEEDPALAGRLGEGVKVKVQERANSAIINFIEKIPETERDSLVFLVVGSPTYYKDNPEYGQRALETASIVMKAIQEVFSEFDIDPNNMLNMSPNFRKAEGNIEPSPRPHVGIVEPKIFTDSPEFVAFLREKYPKDSDFWVAYEGDLEEEKRKELHAEGPTDMGERLQRYIDVIANFSRKFHRNNPGRRLVIWTVTHYDLISPYVKSLLKKDKKESLPVDFEEGFCIAVPNEGDAKAQIGDKEIPIKVRYFQK